ncbi:hypothetical protein ACI65C_007454 [Semiaphis heraclei]
MYIFRQNLVLPGEDPVLRHHLPLQPTLFSDTSCSGRTFPPLIVQKNISKLYAKTPLIAPKASSRRMHAITCTGFTQSASYLQNDLLNTVVEKLLILFYCITTNLFLIFMEYFNAIMILYFVSGCDVLLDEYTRGVQCYKEIFEAELLKASNVLYIQNAEYQLPTVCVMQVSINYHYTTWFYLALQQITFVVFQHDLFMKIDVINLNYLLISSSNTILQSEWITRSSERTIIELRRDVLFQFKKIYPIISRRLRELCLQIVINMSRAQRGNEGAS